jgi:hypothetical protein
MNARKLLLFSTSVFLIAGCGKVSRDFKRAGDDAKHEMVSLRNVNVSSESDLESRREAIKNKLQVVTAATKSPRERDAQATLVNLYVQVSMLKEAQMLPASQGASREVGRLQAKTDQCLNDYDVLVGEKSGDENGPCFTEAKAATRQQ